MNDYVFNRTCQCARCRARGLMGAAVLVTLGVVALIHEFTRFDFIQVIPALLIVIGVMMFLGRSASIEGHVQPLSVVAPVVPSAPPVAGNQPGPEVNR